MVALRLSPFSFEDGMEQEKVNRIFHVGTIFGRNQAYGSMAKLCSAANAQSIKTIRDDKMYLEVEGNWALFCKKRLGVSRQIADKMIHLLEEFGPSYFALAEIIRITPDQFRLIAPAVAENAVRHGDEVITIEPENAPRLAAAAEDLRRAAGTATPAPPPNRDSLDLSLKKTERSLRDAVKNLEKLNAMELPAYGRSRIRHLVGFGVDRLKKIDLLPRT
jgi:hypothetical protein